MKSLTKSLALMILVALVAWSCKPDSVAPKDPTASNGAPSLQGDNPAHPLLSPVCSHFDTLAVGRPDGTLMVDYGGVSNNPWGLIRIYNGEDENGNMVMAMDFDVADNWYISEVVTFVGDGSGLTMESNNAPLVDGNWEVAPVNPVINAYQVRRDLTGMSNCNTVCAKITVGQLDWTAFDGSLDANTIQTLWMINTDWNNSNNAGRTSSANTMMPWCTVSCNPPVVCTPDFTTYNQCDYGLCGQGGDAADARDNLFSTAFPNGLVLGCNSGNTLTLTSSNAVNDFLPSKGGKILNNNKVDPKGKFNNPNNNICPGYTKPFCGTIDFNSTGIKENCNGNPIAAGMEITNQYMDDIGLTIYGESNHPNRTGRVITFDSSNPTGGDTDLGTPNQAYGGPGIGSGGTSSQGRNDVSEGNLIILAENVIDNDGDGLVDNPDDDAAGGTITFDFANPITVQAFTIVDLDDNANNVITLEFADGRPDLVVNVPQIGNNSRKVVMTKKADGSWADGVIRAKISFSGSGAIAGLCYCTPGTLDNACFGDYNGFASTMAGRLAAAKLNVAFDAADPAFGGADFPFADLVVKPNNNPFNGMTVAEVIAEADKFLGGCGSSFTKGQINGALKKINHSYRNGTKQNNFLKCPA